MSGGRQAKSGKERGRKRDGRVRDSERVGEGMDRYTDRGIDSERQRHKKNKCKSKQSYYSRLIYQIT